MAKVRFENQLNVEVGCADSVNDMESGFTAEFDNDSSVHVIDTSPKLYFLTGNRDIWLESPEQVTYLTHLAGAGVGVNKTQMHIQSFIENVRKLIDKNDG